MTLARLLEDAAIRAPGRAALAWEGERITYAELADRAARAAGALRARGVRPGEAVALVLANSPAAVAAFQGALRVGAVVWPLNPLLGAEELRRRVAAADHVVDADKLAGPADRGIAAPAPTDPAVVLQTSGTAGAPTRVELTHGGLRRSAESTARALGFHDEDVLFGAAPLSHVLGMTGCMHAAFASGASVALVPRFEAAGALELIEREGVTVFLGVPAMCVALLAASEQAGRAPALRLAHVGGAPLPIETRRAFEARFGALVLEGYGMTEVGGPVAVQPAGRPPKPGSVGRAIPGLELRIAEDGEVLVRGPMLPKGHRGWLATGDVGRLDADGDLYLLDRKKDVILRGGYTVYPRQVEEALTAHPSVSEAVVVGVPHTTLGEEVAALVVPRGACDPEALKGFVRERVAAYAYPRVIRLVGDLPRGPTGKVLRREIDRAALVDALGAGG